MDDRAPRSRQRTETARRMVDETAERTRQAYGETLRASANAKLPIIDAAMEQWIERMHGLPRRAWLRPRVIGLSLLLSICSGSWELTPWWSSRVQRLMRETQETLQLALAQTQTARRSPRSGRG